MNFTFDVVDVSQLRLVGMTVRTTMEKARTDCPALWMTFAGRIAELCQQPGFCADNPVLERGSFGLSTDMTQEGFTYWAAVSVLPDVEVPAGLEEILLPARSYARCAVPNLAAVGQAFTAMYMEWPTEQMDYAPDMDGVCFELYPQNWQDENSPFSIYGSVIKRG